MFRKKYLSDELFLYLHDSNSIFWAQGIKSEGFFGRTVDGYKVGVEDGLVQIHALNKDHGFHD